MESIRRYATDYRLYGFALLVLGVVASVAAWNSNAAKEELMYETTWTDADGLTHTVTTQIGEDATASAATHAERVAALQEVFPPG